MKSLLKKLLQSNAMLWRAANRMLARHRARAAKRFLIAGNFFPDQLDAIVADFEYSITDVGNRGVPQILNIEELVRHVAGEGVSGAFVECGTYKGGASAYALLSLMRNERGKLARPYWGFDSFEGMPKPSKRDGSYAVRWMQSNDPDQVSNADVSGDLVGSAVNRADYDSCLRYLRATGYPEDKINLVRGWFQETLPVNRTRIGPIAILRMDGDFHESTKVILEMLYDSVTIGGAIIIDDYGAFEGCSAAVNEFLSGRSIRPYLHYVENGIRFFIKT